MSTMIITSGGGRKVNAEYRGFTIGTDQSEDNGGEGSAPEPFMLFLASLGTCAGVYVYSFCQRRGIPTDEIRIGKISLEIEVPEEFPAKYRHALAEAVNLCAVKKQIQNAPEFEVLTRAVGD